MGIINVTMEDVNKVKDYLNHSDFIKHMNDYGLSFSSMAVILTAITDEIEKIEKQLKAEARK